MIVRRSFAIAMLAVLAASCTGGLAPPERHPQRVDAARFPTATPIKHVVFIVKENRSFGSPARTGCGWRTTTAGCVR